MARLAACVSVWAFFLPGLAWAQREKPPAIAPPPLVSHEALQKRLGAADLRLLDARSKAEYAKGHIPGAVWVDVTAAEKLAARAGGLTDRAAWEAWVAPLGIGADTQVLVYDGKRQLDAARTWWLLRYLGLDRVGLVDGNFPLWQAAGRPVSTADAAPSPRPWKVTFRADRLATRDQVLEAIERGSSRIIDARSGAEYAGKEKRSERAGRIPGACHLEWSDLVDKDGRFLPADALRSRLAQRGVREGESLIAHCQGGGRASVDTFALERLGIPTRNYYLGWSDWGNARETPVEKKE
ncbi:MAG: sulfurtransferase [Isosphaeraceae bacterium]